MFKSTVQRWRDITPARKMDDPRLPTDVMAAIFFLQIALVAPSAASSPQGFNKLTGTVCLIWFLCIVWLMGRRSAKGDFHPWCLPIMTLVYTITITLLINNSKFATLLILYLWIVPLIFVYMSWKQITLQIAAMMAADALLALGPLHDPALILLLASTVLVLGVVIYRLAEALRRYVDVPVADE